MNPTCRQIRQHVLDIAAQSGHGHIPTCFSVVEMITAVYEHFNHDPKNPGWDQRDVFILSKAHAALAYYCVLAEFGYFDIENVRSFGSFMSSFGCHPDRTKLPGVEVSAGSLGHGIGLAVGTALAMRIHKQDQRRVYTLIGDGESNEGTVWESVMVAANLSLENLTILYDNNQSHSRGLQITDPVEKFRAFDCGVVEVDGHDLDELKDAFGRDPGGKPKVVVANTVKGYGCELLTENQYAWHRRSPNPEELTQLREQLHAKTV